jgi:hypothetical protein
LLDYPTSLEKIVGADLSKKSLSRAAKVWIISEQCFSAMLYGLYLLVSYTLELVTCLGYC